MIGTVTLWVELPIEFSYETSPEEGDGHHEPHYQKQIWVTGCGVDWDVASEMADKKIKNIDQLKDWIMERYHDDVVLEIPK